MPVVSFSLTLRTILLHLLFRHASSTLTNRTIDDYFGDSVTGLKPTYDAGANDWNYGPACPGCFVQPDRSETFDQSWHDTTVSPTDSSPQNVTLTFNGTAVWVYCIIPNYVPYATTFVNISFNLDGHTVGAYSHLPSDANDMQYNVTVYSNTSLDNTQHTLVMTPRRDVNSSIMLFDWAKYTYDSDVVTTSTTSTTAITSTSSTSAITSTTSTSAITHSDTATGTSAVFSITPYPTYSSSSSHTTVGPIVGGLLGGLGALVVALVIFILIRRRRRQEADQIYHVGGERGREEAIDEIEPMAKPEPFTDHPTTTQLALPPVTIQHEETRSPAATNGASRSAYATVPSDLASASDPALSIAVAVSASMAPSSSSGQRRRTKGAMRREELSRQMRDIEQHVAALRRRQSSNTGAPSDAPYAPPPVPAPVEAVHDDSELRRQIETLQLEVERLRSEQAAVMDEPPPAYEFEEES